MLGFGTDDRDLDAEIFEGMMNSFPAQKCRELTKQVVLQDGSALEVSFGSSIPKAEILYGDDRDLLKWLLKRFLKTGEADVSWEMLLEYLGVNPTASQKKAIFEAALRIATTGATLDHDGVFLSMNLVASRLSSQPTLTLVTAEKDFQGEIQFEFNVGLLELMRGSGGPRIVKGGR